MKNTEEKKKKNTSMDKTEKIPPLFFSRKNIGMSATIVAALAFIETHSFWFSF